MNRSDFLPIFFLAFFSVAFFGGYLTKKLVGYHDWNSVVYAASARSLIGQAETGEIFYQQNYPLFLPATLALSFLLFGIHEWSIRLVPIFFTMSTSVMIYILAKDLKGKRVGVIAAFLYLNTPLIRYYGKIPIHETVVPFFALLIFYTYWLWYKENTLKKYFLLLVSIFFAEQFGWPGYFPVLLITLHYFIFSKKKKAFSILNWWFISFLSFLFFLLSNRLITGRFPFQSLWSIFVIRAGFDKSDPYTFTWLQFIKKEFLWLRIYLTRILSLFVVIGLIKLLVTWIRDGLKTENGLLISLGIFGSMYLLIFRQASWLHEYVIIYLFPFFSIVGALVLESFASKIKIPLEIITILVLFFMFMESRKFIVELEKVDTYYPGYKLGIFVNKKTKAKEKVLFLSKASSKMYGLYFYFYANRSYEALEPSLEEFKNEVNFYSQNYRFLVVDKKNHKIDNELLFYLKERYKFTNLDQFQVFKL